MEQVRTGQAPSQHFIIIDDDPINNIICSKVIKASIPQASIKTFTEPQKGLNYIQSTYAASDVDNAVLFLDINMPSLSGWELLDRFKDFNECTRNHLKIFMLSSSVNQADKDLADNNLLVSGFISKPLSVNMLHSILPGSA